MYKVLTPFTDDQDSKHVYNTGDAYPRADCAAPPDDKRIEYLSGKENKLGRPVIQSDGPKKADKPPKQPKPDDATVE